MAHEKAGRWLRLDSSWRSERAARRAGRAGRDVFLAAAEMTCEHGWGVAGERGWLPDETWDVREVAAHLGESDSDAAVLAELEAGLAACVREGLLERDDAARGHWIARDWWERMLPDRTARHRKAAERGVKGGAEGVEGSDSARHGNCRDSGAAAGNASGTSEPGSVRSEPVTATSGNCRDIHTGTQETAHPSDDGRASRQLPVVTATPGNCREERQLPDVTAIAAYETLRDVTRRESTTPVAPADAGAIPDQAAPSECQREGPPLSPGDRAAVPILLRALAASKLAVETTSEAVARCNANHAATMGPSAGREAGKALADSLRAAEAERRRRVIAAMEAGDAGVIRWALQEWRDHAAVKWDVKHAYDREAREARGRRTRREPPVEPATRPAAVTAPTPTPTPAVSASQRPEREHRSELPEMTDADRAHVLGVIERMTSEVGQRGMPAVSLMNVPAPQRGQRWWAQAAGVYATSFLRPTSLDRTLADRDIAKLAETESDEGFVEDARRLDAVQEAFRWGAWYRAARAVLTAAEEREERKRQRPAEGMETDGVAA